MTGFGAARSESHVASLSVEVRTVNHRHLDVRWHVPAEHAALCAELEPELKGRFLRGRVDVRLSVDPGTHEHAHVVDIERARTTVQQLRRTAQELGLRDDLSSSCLLQIPGVLRRGVDWDPEALMSPLREALLRAADEAVDMRVREGAATARDLSGHLSSMKTQVDDLATRLQDEAGRRAGRLKRRLAELLGDHAVDPTRLAQEVAVLADRSDVTEEIERFGSHIRQFKVILGETGPVGRKLDFLAQEMFREVNTIGSKAPDASFEVVHLKSDLEKVREQVQNLE